MAGSDPPGQCRCSNHEADLPTLLSPGGGPATRRLLGQCAGESSCPNTGVTARSRALPAGCLRLFLLEQGWQRLSGGGGDSAAAPHLGTYPTGSVTPGDPEAWQLACGHLAGSQIRSPCQASVTGAAARGAERWRATTCSGNWTLGQLRAPRLGPAPPRQAGLPAQLRLRHQLGQRRCRSGRSSRFKGDWKALERPAGAAPRLPG